MSDEAWRAGSETHYEDAHYYDQSYRRRRDDVRWYVETVRASLGKGSGSAGPVLELGVGTGRVALALAREGIEVVGVDAMAPMLDRFRERLAREPSRVRSRITLHQGDLRRLDLGRTFRVVTAPFHVFNHLYTREEMEGALAAVHAHLRPRGRFVFDVRHPDPSELARDPNKVYKGRNVTLPGTGRRYHYRERYDYDPVHQVQTVEMAFVGVDDPTDFHLQLLTHRCWFPAELSAALHYNRFAVLDQLGDFAGEPLDETHDTQVYVCRKRR